MAIDAFSAPLTRLGLMALLGILVLGLSVVTVPALLSDDAGSSAPGTSSSTTLSAAGNESPEDPTSALLTTARISAEGIVLEGVVSTEGQRDALVDSARRRVGPPLVEDQLMVATGLATSEGRDNGVIAMQSFLAGVPDGVTVAVTSAEGRLEVVGEATTAEGLASIQTALDAAAAAAPGTVTLNEVEVPPPPPPTPEELAAAAQAELSGLNEQLTAVVLFATSSNEPTDDFTALLDGVPEILGRHPQIRVEVVGHTDDRGSEGGNLELSEERAQAAVDYLVGLGVPAERITARGAGEAEPIDTNTTRDGRARNRRVELIALPG